MRLRAVAPALVLLALTGAGDAKTSFALRLSTGGVTRLQVGQTVQLAAYPPATWWSPGMRKPGEDPPPLRPIDTAVWRVEPPGPATIDAAGLLTAVAPGEVTLHVADSRPAKANAPLWGSPGSERLTISARVPGGRLPRFERAPPIQSFRIGWLEGSLLAEVGTLTARATVGPVRPAEPVGPLPWRLSAEPSQASYDDQTGSCCPQDAPARAVASATLTVSAWVDGVASGRFELTTADGEALDFAFHAPLSDPERRLAQAAAVRPEAPK